MTEKGFSESFKISPSRGPFLFHAWLELPFPVTVNVDQRFSVDYQKNVLAELRMIIQRNVYKVVTGNRWLHNQEVRRWADCVRSGDRELIPRGWRHEYILEKELPSFVAELEASEHTRYVHVEAVYSVVYLSSLVPYSIIPTCDFLPSDLAPRINFFTEEVLPRLQTIISAYRISVLPWMRYSIPPVSEALVDSTIMRCTDKEGIPLGDNYYTFDHRSPMILSFMSSPPGLQARFDQILPQLPSLEAEDQMASAYCLYRMRRWAEAIAVASSVVDGLLRNLVFHLASTEIEAKAMWKAYGYKELFNEVFPKFGKPKLSSIDQKLWDVFLKAKEYRGSKSHGDHPKPFDHDQEDAVKRYLQAFHDVARWLKRQMGHLWVLDIFENGERLKPFP